MLPNEALKHPLNGLFSSLGAAQQQAAQQMMPPLAQFPPNSPFSNPNFAQMLLFGSSPLAALPFMSPQHQFQSGTTALEMHPLAQGGFLPSSLPGSARHELLPPSAMLFNAATFGPIGGNQMNAAAVHHFLSLQQEQQHKQRQQHQQQHKFDNQNGTNEEDSSTNKAPSAFVNEEKHQLKSETNPLPNNKRIPTDEDDENDDEKVDVDGETTSTPLLIRNNTGNSASIIDRVTSKLKKRDTFKVSSLLYQPNGSEHEEQNA